MPGFCFARVEVFARKSRSDSRMNRTVSEVLDEADRVDGNMPHVKKPRKPVVVDGCSIDELRALHDEVENAKQVQKNGRERKIRTTQNTLATAVLSYPVSVDDLRKQGREAQIVYMEWRKDAVDFMKREWGDDFKCAVEHVDEKFPHLHLYALNKQFDAKEDHPGYRAQKEALANGKSAKEAEIAGAVALKGFLNRYHEEVGQKYGMSRFGPKRERLTRKVHTQRTIARDAYAEELRDRKAYRDSVKSEVSRKWSEMSVLGKMSFARSKATSADIEKRAKEKSDKVIRKYSSGYENAEKAITKAVSGRKQAEQKSNKLGAEVHRLGAEVRCLLSEVQSKDHAMAQVEYALSENVHSLHDKARRTGKLEDYYSLSGACQGIYEARKANNSLFGALWGDVRIIIQDVKKTVPAVFCRTFQWVWAKGGPVSRSRPLRVEPVPRVSGSGPSFRM